MTQGQNDVTSRDVVDMLRRHYFPEGRPAAGVLAVEIGAPDSQRRADAIWAPLTTSGGTGLAGHEIKVSRSDVVVELADPTKADAWAKYCTHWWLTISDPSLIDGLDIPDHWGVMAPPSGRRTRSMTIIKKAPTMKVSNDGPAWRRVFAWQAHKHESANWRTQQDKRMLEHDVERLRETIKDLRSQTPTKDDPTSKVVREIVANMRDLSAHNQQWRLSAREIDVAAVALAAYELQQARELTKNLQSSVNRLIDQVDRLMQDPLKYIKQELQALAVDPAWGK